MTNSYTLKELADHLNAPWQGDADATVHSIANLAHASSGDLSFLSKKQFQHYLDSTQAGVIILREGTNVQRKLNIIYVADPYVAYARVSELFNQRPQQPAGIHPSATVDPSAKVARTAAIGPNCVVGAHCTIGEHAELLAGVVLGAHCIVGDDCVLHANVVLYHGVSLGARVKIHSSTVVGSDGFGYAPSDGAWEKIHQLGSVMIGNDVEIGASTTIDRGAIDDTIIEDNVIIDNQVHIAHNVKIGRATAIAGCVGIAGSTTIGAHCTLGGFVAIGGHLQIADNVHFNGSTVVTKSITEAGHYSSGTMVQEVKLWRRNAVRFGQLDSWVERIKKLEQADKS